MATIAVQEFITLDGVVQAPGVPDEDRDGGFEHGGWAMAYDEKQDPAGELGSIIGAWERKTDALLLGRKTCDIWAASWGVWDENAPGPESELTRRYNRVPKYVASRTLTDPTWKNSHLLGPDLPAAVAALRARPGSSASGAAPPSSNSSPPTTSSTNTASRSTPSSSGPARSSSPTASPSPASPSPPAAPSPPASSSTPTAAPPRSPFL